MLAQDNLLNELGTHGETRQTFTLKHPQTSIFWLASMLRVCGTDLEFSFLFLLQLGAVGLIATNEGGEHILSGVVPSRDLDGRGVKLR